VTVNVHHIREATPKEPPPAGPYVFSSPGHMGKPIGGMRRFLKKVELPAGLPYAILTAELAPQPDKKTGRVPTEQKMAKWQRVRPVMNEILLGKGTCRGRGGQRPGDRAQGAAGAGLAAEGRGLRGPASPPGLIAEL